VSNVGRPALDIKGKRFGRLLVLERTEPPNDKNEKYSWWKCKCDCGNEKTIVGGSLTGGSALSCGCLDEENKKSRYLDVTGQRFGKLVAVEKLDKSRNNRALWKCICDCGNVCEVSVADLGINTLSCGCLKAEILTEDCVEKTRLRNLTSKKRARKTRDSGVKGVVWSKSKQKWVAQIGFKGKHIHLGYFSEDDLDLAIEARKAGEEKYFKPVLEKYNKE
jgi:hypothetical protein